MVVGTTAFIAAATVGAVLTPLVRRAALRSGAVDHGLTSRKIHVGPIPRLGGIAIVAASLLACAGVFAYDAVEVAFLGQWRLVAALFGGGLAIAALGLYDDLHGADAKKKFAVQFLVAAVAFGAGFRIDSLHLPILGALDLGPFGLPLTLIWIVGVINALNLIDGLDGLAGGIAVVAALAFVVLAFASGDRVAAVFGAALAGAVLAFLFFNFNPASIFMGDTGSMFLGFLLATLGIRAGRQADGDVALLVPVLVLGVPIADTLLAMTRRACRGMPMFSADRGHIHHRLLAKGLSQRETALTLYGSTAVLAIGGCSLIGASRAEALVALALLAAFSLVALRWLGFLDRAKICALLAERRRNLARRGQISQVTAQLKNAAEPVVVWQSLLGAAPALDVDHVALRTRLGSWKSPANHAGQLHLVRYGLHPERPGAEVLELGWADGRGEIDRDTEIAIEELCGHVRSALARFEAAGVNGAANGLGRPRKTA